MYLLEKNNNIFKKMFLKLVKMNVKLIMMIYLIYEKYFIRLSLYFIPDGAGTNKQHVTTKNTAKLDRETEELRHEKVPLEVGKLIMQGRQAKGLSQKDLATVS